jgi:ABC-type transport system substrate-binding protein
MTAGDIPATTGNPDQGFEGFRFVGYNLYDGLALWDLSSSDKPSDIRPGLATEWQVDPNDHRRWIYKLREGVKWHDGCPFTADDVVWNFGRITDDKAPQFYTQQMALSRAYTTNFASVEKLDDHQGGGITVSLSDQLYPDGEPVPGEAAELRLECLCRAPVGHRPVPVRPHGGA